MRLISIFLKDARAFFRDIRSFVLLFLTPVMLVFIIGISFVGTSTQSINILVCSTEDNEVNDYIKDTISTNSNFILEKVQLPTDDDCRKTINNRMLDTSIHAGAIIYKRDMLTTRIDLIVDNSKLVSDYIKSYFTIVTNDISQKITKGYVDILFSNIDEVKSSVDEVETKMRYEKTRLERIKKDLLMIKSNISSIKNNLVAASSNLDSINNELDTSIYDVNNANSRLSGASASIASAVSAVNALGINDSEKVPIIASLGFAKDSLTSASSTLSGIGPVLANSKARTSQTKLLISATQLDSVMANLDYIISAVDASIVTVDDVLDKISTLQETIQNANLEKPESTQFVNANVTNFFYGNKFIDFLFPTAVMMVIMVLSTFLASITFIRHRTTGLLQRISIAPNGMSILITERLLFIAVMSIIALPFMLIVGIFTLGVVMTPINFIYMIVACFATSLIFSSIGLIIASLSKYESTAILLSILVTLPMIFLSGILIPLERLPNYLTFLTSGLPLNISVKIFESIIFYSSSMGTVLHDIGLLAAYFIVAVVLAWIFTKRSVRS